MLGILGIDGSPSCGVHFTYDGNWGGELSTNPNLNKDLHSLCKKDYPGIFMKVFQQILKEENLDIPFYSIETFSFF